MLIKQSRSHEIFGRIASRGKMLDEIYTVGHSTRTFDELIGLLRSHGVERLVDVRRFPASRRYPHFSGESLRQALPGLAIDYEHASDLGGRRSTSPASVNTGLRNAAFRGYADYMQTLPFLDAVTRLLASERRSAIMCAEAVPWRCHRNLISDELVRRGVVVRHIISAADPKQHALHAAARIGEGFVYYPSPHNQGKLFG